MSLPELKALTKDLSEGGILISEDLYKILEDKLIIEKSMETNLKGKQGTFLLHQISGLKSETAEKGEKLKIAKIKNRLKYIVTRYLAPAFLRLAFHDALNGSQGSIRLEKELSRPENKGLEVVIDGIRNTQESLKQDKIYVSMADLIALCGAMAVEKCGGPFIPLGLGRIDMEESSLPLMPDETMAVKTFKDLFAARGLDTRDLVALSGAHTLGVCARQALHG